jgi:F0F1-type ATP synthase membrane subunit c/vacuolar-type H+-ATPase subunit K
MENKKYSFHKFFNLLFVFVLITELVLLLKLVCNIYLIKNGKL